MMRVATAAPSLSTERSAALFQAASRVIPGGVNSPVRAFRSVGGTPRFIARGAGARVTDADGNEYIDYVLSWGALALGHAHPAVVDAIAHQAALGTSFGAPTELETELADRIVRAVPSVEMLRFVSSGTEAASRAGNGKADSSATRNFLRRAMAASSLAMTSRSTATPRSCSSRKGANIAPTMRARCPGSAAS